MLIPLGKTILSSVIIEACTHDKTFTTSYFYCKDGDPARNTCVAILKGLLMQLLGHRRHLVPFCYDRYLSSGELTLNSVTLSTQLLELFCDEVPKQCIIIDGLDECEKAERKSVLSFFTKVVERCDDYEPGKLRILFVSQNWNDIKTALPVASVVSSSPADDRDDIKSYVNAWTEKIRNKFELSEIQAKAITASTCARAAGSSLIPPSQT